MLPTYIIWEYGVGERTSNPTNYHSTSKWYEASSRHMTKIAEVIKWQMEPLVCGVDYQIVSLQASTIDGWLEQNIEELKKVPVVCSASVGKFVNESPVVKYYKDILFTTSSGNDGEDGTIYNKLKKYGLSIGAITFDSNMPTVYSSYSSADIDYVDYVGKANFVRKFEYKGKMYREQFIGTSYSCPYFTANVFKMMVINNIISPAMAILNVRLNVIDVYKQGKDHKTGLGYYTYNRGDKVMNFKDYDTIPSWAKEAMDKAIVSGVIKGDGETLGHDKQPTTAQLMVYLDRCGVLGK